MVFIIVIAGTVITIMILIMEKIMLLFLIRLYKDSRNVRNKNK